MMVGGYVRKCREVPGPMPGSFAIRARPPNKHPPDFWILERRKLEESLKYVAKKTDSCTSKIEWEIHSMKRMQRNNVQKKIDQMKRANEFNVEDRRERLRDLLQTEKTEFLDEMASKEETTIERQAKMRDRAKFLKDKREEERLQFVQEKLDQQFRTQCEELRSTVSKRQQDQVCVERLDQLRQKEEMGLEKAAHDAMYAELWDQDRLKKAAREEAETKAQFQRNKDTLEVLRQQMAALEQQKDEERKLKDEEAQLLREQAALRKLEEEQAWLDKVRKQKETRDMLDLSLKLKMKKRAREEQEQLAFDLKILEQLLEESRNEAREQLQRKQDLREEDARYRDYLAHMIEDERRKEEEVERLILQDMEKQWQKRLEKWKKERLARRKLLLEVVAARAEQVRRRLMLNEQAQLEGQREKEELLLVIEKNKRLEEERLAKLRQKTLQYRTDLEGQMDHNRRIHDTQLYLEDEEYRLGQQAEQEYQEKLREALNSSHVDNMHPARRYLMSQ